MNGRTSNDARRSRLGLRIREMREQLGMTQSEFAAPQHTTSWLCDVERGRNGIDVFDLEDLCSKAGVPVSALLGPAPAKVPQSKSDWDLLFANDPNRAQAHYLLDQAWPRPRAAQRRLTAVS